MSTPDYDSDFYAWTQHQAAAIRAGQWEAIDREHVAEEIGDLWHQDRHDSATLVLGFLELAYGACGNEMGQYYWQSVVVDHHRGMLRLSLKESPQLRPYPYPWVRLWYSSRAPWSLASAHVLSHVLALTTSCLSRSTGKAPSKSRRWGIDA